jgi:putative ABC transport system permease protein
LGARRVQVLQLILGRAGVLLAFGVGLGLAAALALARFLQSMLFGVGASDPRVFMVVTVLLAAVAGLASYIPARRATKVDPTVALRYE